MLILFIIVFYFSLYLAKLNILVGRLLNLLTSFSYYLLHASVVFVFKVRLASLEAPLDDKLFVFFWATISLSFWTELLPFFDWFAKSKLLLLFMWIGNDTLSPKSTRATSILSLLNNYP